jgi:hypothetical protein
MRAVLKRVLECLAVGIIVFAVVYLVLVHQPAVSKVSVVVAAVVFVSGIGAWLHRSKRTSST